MFNDNDVKKVNLSVLYYVNRRYKPNFVVIIVPLKYGDNYPFETYVF